MYHVADPAFIRIKQHFHLQQLTALANDKAKKHNQCQLTQLHMTALELRRTCELRWHWICVLKWTLKHSIMTYSWFM